LTISLQTAHPDILHFPAHPDILPDEAATGLFLIQNTKLIFLSSVRGRISIFLP
jgi:hypothetical protein